MGKLTSFVLILFLQYFMASLSWSEMNSTTDKSALLAFKSSIVVDPYNLLANWSVSSSPCDWVGVQCNTRHERVHSLNLSDMGLTGVISPQLGNLSFLVKLDLSINNFHGEIPKELVQLRRLKQLNLSYNDFHGKVPTWIGRFSMLAQLDLSNNSLGGFIPPSLSNLSRLEILDWSNNFIEGTIPVEVGKLEYLQLLNFGDNRLSGNIPLTISNLSSLEILNLRRNRLTGMSWRLLLSLFVGFILMFLYWFTRFCLFLHFILIIASFLDFLFPKKKTNNPSLSLKCISNIFYINNNLVVSM